MKHFIKKGYYYLCVSVLLFASCTRGDHVDPEDIDDRKMYIGIFSVHFIEMGGDWYYPQTQFSRDTTINVEFFFNKNEFVSLLPYYGPLKSFRMKYKIDSVDRQMLFSFEDGGKLKQPNHFGYPAVIGKNGFFTADSINFTLSDLLNRNSYYLSIVGKRI